MIMVPDNYYTKSHVLFNHSIFFLETSKGFSDIGEDRIKRAHKDGTRTETRLMRLRHITIKMQSQVNFQHIKINPCVISNQTKVANKQTRIFQNESASISKKN